MSNLNKTHIYDLGEYKFNESEDVDLVDYDRIGYGSFHNNLNFKPQSSTKLKIGNQSSVPEVPNDSHNAIVIYATPYTEARKATKALFVGLKTIIERVNERLQKFSGSSSVSLDLDRFIVTEFARIRSINQKVLLYFPVEMSQLVSHNGSNFDVCINFDNPTSLPLRNQSSGCQGSHFGFTIIRRNSGERTRGHVLITTFIGFPSRNEAEKKATREALEKDPQAQNVLRVSDFCKTAMKDQIFPFDITTEAGINKTALNEHIHASERTSRLPKELKAIHNTFRENQFRLPDLDDKCMIGYFTKFSKMLKPKPKLP